MPNETHEQETLTESDVVSLLNDEAPQSAPSRKGYDDYVAQAESEAATSDASDDNGDESDKAEASGFKMPEKFNGKTAEEIAASYQQLEQEFGRRNTEVGSLRKLTDQLLELNTEPKKEEAPAKELGVDDLLNNPGDTINSAVESNPRIKAIEEKLQTADREVNRQAFEQKHTDWKEVIGSDDFASWILESPLRKQLFQASNANYDYATGAELLDLYKSVKGNAIVEAKEERNTKARKSAKAAVTESGGSTESKGKPKFKRAELIELKMRDPHKYEAMKETIMEAYANNRVI